MTKKAKRLDNQTSFFDLLKNVQDEQPKLMGSMNIDRQLRQIVSEDLKRCPQSRYHVAAVMSELTGEEITKSMIDSWTSESHVKHRMPAVFIPAFCHAVSSTRALMLMSQPVGSFLLPGPEALRAEIQRLDEDIARKQGEKRKRVLFLKEMEGV